VDMFVFIDVNTYSLQKDNEEDIHQIAIYISWHVFPSFEMASAEETSLLGCCTCGRRCSALPTGGVRFSVLRSVSEMVVKKKCVTHSLSD
jgi:hypothetical protein